MRISTVGRGLIVAFALSAPVGLALAQKGTGHPNLAAAQKLAAQAFDKLVAAQKANEYELGGHAAKAKDLLKQANDEIKLAVEAADKNGGTKPKADPLDKKR